MTDVEASPRSTKRPRTGTYRGSRSILGSSVRSNRQSNVSSRLSSIAKNLFGSNQPQQEVDQDHDSAYASKEDSLNEEHTVLSQEGGNPQEAQTEDATMGNTTPSTRRSTRTSADGSASPEQEGVVNTERDVTKRRSSGRPPKVVKSKINQDVQKGLSSARHLSAENSKATLAVEPASPRESQSSHSQLPRKPSQQARRKVGDDSSHHPRSDVETPGNTVERTVDTQEPAPRSSGRTRKRPRWLSDHETLGEVPKLSQKARAGDIESAIGSPQPKGILTPSRRKREGSRKSVLFKDSEKQVEEHLGFKDIDTSVNKKTSLAEEATSGKADLHAKKKAPTETAPADDDILFDPKPPEDILQSLELPRPSALASTKIEDSPSVTAIKFNILSRLTSRSLTNPSHLETQYNTIHTLLSSAITAGESNSLLLLGSRGSGKSSLINNALSDLSTKHSNDFHIVRLNGFFQTDDKLALREIWRQLGREMAVDESETGEVMGSYADTMASLLSLLSHPDELDPEAMDVDSGVARASKSVIMVLDEFDLFTTHPRQTLLYNLFDIAQSRKAPIAVIGCSTRMDVVECLEKRVKSRFSHRWLHVPNVKSLSGFQEALEGVLCVKDDDVIEKMDEKDRQRWNEYIKTSFLPSEPVQTLLASTFHTTKSLPSVLSALYIPIATLSLDESTSSTKSAASQSKSKPSTKTPTQTSTPTTVSTFTPLTNSHPSFITLLPTLPALHLTLLIAATRLESLHLAPTLNFNAVYAHYLQLHQYTRLKSSSLTSGTASSLRSWTKETCRGAWEDLVRWELLVPVNRGQDGKMDSADGSDGARWYRVEVTLEEVAWGVREKFSSGVSGGGGGGIGEVLGRWCREEMVGW